MGAIPFRHVPDVSHKAQWALRRNFESLGEAKATFPVVLNDGTYTYHVEIVSSQLQLRAVRNSDGATVLMAVGYGQDVNVDASRDFNLHTHNDFNQQVDNDWNLRVGQDLNIGGPFVGNNRDWNVTFRRDINFIAAHDINLEPVNGNLNVKFVNFEEQSPATTPGTVIAKAPVYTYDQAGNRTLLGYLPIYDTIL